MDEEDALSISARSTGGRSPEHTYADRQGEADGETEEEDQSSGDDEEAKGHWETGKGLKLKLKRTYVDLTDESEEEVVIRLKKPKLGVRRIVKVEVHSKFYVEGYGETRLVRSCVDTSYPDADGKEEQKFNWCKCKNMYVENV